MSFVATFTEGPTPLGAESYYVGWVTYDDAYPLNNSNKINVKCKIMFIKNVK